MTKKEILQIVLHTHKLPLISKIFDHKLLSQFLLEIPGQNCRIQILCRVNKFIALILGDPSLSSDLNQNTISIVRLS